MNDNFNKVKNSYLEQSQREDDVELSSLKYVQIENISCWQLYQQMCDNIFGVNAITIKAAPDNNIIGTLKNICDYTDFHKVFANRLTRLRNKFHGTTSYNALLKTVMQVADSKNWEGAYAELVAYDIMCNDRHEFDFQLDVSLSASESYAGDLQGKETNEDVYLPDFGIYFDIKCLQDTTGNILKELIHEAIRKENVEGICTIQPEYPLDDDEADYQHKRGELIKELTCYIHSHLPKNKSKSSFESKVLPNLRYRILWGKGVNISMGSYNPYIHAEATKDLMLERYMKKFMKSNPFFIVFVNFPWYNKRIDSFDNSDEIYYRALARRTFLGYLHDNTSVTDIQPKYTGAESKHEISRHLTGIIFIDDHGTKTDTYSCHIYLNPFAANPLSASGKLYIEQLFMNADIRSVLDDFSGDVY